LGKPFKKNNTIVKTKARLIHALWPGRGLAMEYFSLPLFGFRASLGVSNIERLATYLGS
jgi:hypothetical protein